MSNNAYKVIKIKSAKESTFSIWHDDFIVDTFALGNQLNDDGGGLVTITKEDVDEALESIKEESFAAGEKEHYTTILKNILKDMAGEESVSYICG